MGSRGPLSQSPDLKIERGNPGKRAVDTDTPELEALAIAPPPGLPAAARAEWIRLAADLVEAGILSKADMGLFREYCEIHSELDRLKKRIKRMKGDDAQKLGYNNLLIKTRGQYTLIASRLGLSPTTRHAVKKIKGKKQTEEGRSRFFGNRKQANTG